MCYSPHLSLFYSSVLTYPYCWLITSLAQVKRKEEVDIELNSGPLTAKPANLTMSSDLLFSSQFL